MSPTTTDPAATAAHWTSGILPGRDPSTDPEPEDPREKDGDAPAPREEPDPDPPAREAPAKPAARLTLTAAQG